MERLPVCNTVLSGDAHAPAGERTASALKQTVFNKDPSANPAAVDKQVNDYLRGLATALSGDPEKAKKQATANATQDWDAWLDGN